MQYVLGSHTLDLKRRELRSPDGAVVLPPKVLSLLVHLITCRDRVVPKDELLQSLWPGVHVSDASLTSCIKAARSAVGDDGRSQQTIQTFHRHGYRYVGPVTLAPVVQGETPTAAIRSCKRRQIVGVLHVAPHNVPVLARRLSLEALDDLAESLAALAVTVVERHGGAVSQQSSGETLALFGAGSADGRVCYRTVAAALDLRAAVADLPISAGLDLAIKIGVHRGEVMIGPMDPVSGQIRTTMGATTERARAIMDLAPPGAVLASRSVRDVLGSEVEAGLFPVVGAGGLFRIHRLIGNAHSTGFQMKEGLDGSVLASRPQGRGDLQCGGRSL